MAIGLTKTAIDLGMVVRDLEPMLAFYRDVLGFVPVPARPVPGGIQITRLMCGESQIKLVLLEETPAAASPPGGLFSATGIRYWTIWVDDLDGIFARATAAGAPVAMPITDVRPNVRAALVEDPEGNWVEFLDSRE